MTPYHFFKKNDRSDTGLAVNTCIGLKAFERKSGKGFTLIETMAAVTLLTIAITAPMSLAVRSLSTAYYARDEITASYLAQDAIESVRHARDNNILYNVHNPSAQSLWTGTLATDGTPFTVDTLNNDAMTTTNCPGGVCVPLKINKSTGLYGYTQPDTSRFTRTVQVTSLAGGEELRVEVKVSWQAGVLQTKQVVLSENLYHWY